MSTVYLLKKCAFVFTFVFVTNLQLSLTSNDEKKVHKKSSSAHSSTSPLRSPLVEKVKDEPQLSNDSEKRVCKKSTSTRSSSSSWRPPVVGKVKAEPQLSNDSENSARKHGRVLSPKRENHSVTSSPIRQKSLLNKEPQNKIPKNEPNTNEKGHARMQRKLSSKPANFSELSQSSNALRAAFELAFPSKKELIFSASKINVTPQKYLSRFDRKRDKSHIASISAADQSDSSSVKCYPTILDGQNAESEYMKNIKDQDYAILSSQGKNKKGNYVDRDPATLNAFKLLVQKNRKENNVCEILWERVTFPNSFLVMSYNPEKVKLLYKNRDELRVISNADGHHLSKESKDNFIICDHKGFIFFVMAGFDQFHFFVLEPHGNTEFLLEDMEDPTTFENMLIEKKDLHLKVAVVGYIHNDIAHQSAS